jgi:hypothetical protein
MKKLLICAALATAATTLHAAIIYSATIGCAESCVTVSLSWAESFPVNYADVEDSSDNVIFTLNLGSFAGQTTGEISPYPQTFSPLSSTDISEISSGQAYVSITSIAPGLLGGGDGGPDSDGAIFSAQVVPEPEAWSLTAAGLALLFLYARTARRKRRT